MALPTDPQARKDIPLAAVIDYFHDALAELALLIKAGNDQHNPGEPIYWNRDKSGDEADALLRHFVERGTIDSDGRRHSGKVAWRALALLQKEIEEQEGLPISRGSRSPKAEAAAAQMEYEVNARMNENHVLTNREMLAKAVAETEAPLEAVPPVKVGDRLYNRFFKAEGTVVTVYDHGEEFEVRWDNREYPLPYRLANIDGGFLRFV